MTKGVEVANSPVLREGDLRQAEYFRQMLDGRKAEICEQLEAELDALARFQSAGDAARAGRHRRLVKALESELRTVDRMLLAVRVRLGLPTLRRTS
jgi:hypothetical protein